VSFTLHLSAFTRKQLYRRLQQAYASGSLKLVKRIHALLAGPIGPKGAPYAAFFRGVTNVWGVSPWIAADD
jgi:hypothetical protein